MHLCLWLQKQKYMNMDIIFKTRISIQAQHLDL